MLFPQPTHTVKRLSRETERERTEEQQLPPCLSLTRCQRAGCLPQRQTRQGSPRDLPAEAPDPRTAMPGRRGYQQASWPRRGTISPPGGPAAFSAVSHRTLVKQLRKLGDVTTSSPYGEEDWHSEKISLRAAMWQRDTQRASASKSRTAQEGTFQPNESAWGRRLSSHATSRDGERRGWHPRVPVTGRPLRTQQHHCLEVHQGWHCSCFMREESKPSAHGSHDHRSPCPKGDTSMQSAETEVSREKASRKDESPDGLVQDMQKFSP